VTLAKIVGPEGRVVATDQSVGMLAVAGERIKDEGLGNIELIEADTESLDLPENEFDGTVCRWGLMFLPDLQAGLQAIRRSLKPGAKFATAVWSTPDKTPVLSIPIMVAQQMLDPAPAPPPPPALAPNLFSLGPAGALESALSAAGFNDVEGNDLQIDFDMESSQAYAEFLRGISPPVQAMLVGRPKQQVDQFWNAVVSKSDAFVNDNGVFKMPNIAPIAVGTK
jgi:SAM-dependent methyltransferase